jgi:hypothetical protein
MDLRRNSMSGHARLEADCAGTGFRLFDNPMTVVRVLA